MEARVLVIGSGGREHALSWKLAQSSQVGAVYVAPGNAGTKNAGKISNVDVKVKDFEAVVTWCQTQSVSLVVVGPEDPLADGIADVLKKNDIPCFGPSAAAAQIEASKKFAKDFMTRHSIPTARWQAFTDHSAAADYIKNADFEALVVKASGLAAGKGVIVAKDRNEACQAAKDILQDNKFGSAGSTVVIEELLVGEEVSCLAFSDGKSIACFPPAQDHKRALDGDLGLNTGGMGAYCPCPLVSKADMEVIKSEVLQRAVDGMAAEGTPYVGVLYAGLMLTKDGPKTLEYNCRFGDPETQVILPLLETDLYTVMTKCVSGELDSLDLSFQDAKKAVAVVAVSGGYPGSYKKGFEITGLEKVEKDGCVVFHAGTASKDEKVLTSGGRVLAVVALDDDLDLAARRAQHGVADIQFEGKFFRKDIAHKAMKTKLAGGLSYKDAGVDIGAGDNLVQGIKSFAAMTARSGCSPDLGLFGGLFDLKATGFTDPLLVSGTDGVGTKLKIAQLCGLHTTIGQDLVAMCVNDILCHGAEPLFFLDYFACGKLEVGVAKEVIEGVANGCKTAGCALLGGETAEMPGMYSPGDYDLAGFAVGAVERPQYLPRVGDVTSGDVMVAVGSSGVHSNGFSLVRKVVDHCGLTYSDTCPWDESQTLGSVLLTPTQIYVQSMLGVLRTGLVKAVAHITGGGLPGNVNRVLPQGLGVTLNAKAWTMPPVFGWLQAKGNIETAEMARTFNCGVGMVLVVAESDHEQILEQLRAKGEHAVKAGHIIKRDEGAEQVKVVDLDLALDASWRGVRKHQAEDVHTDQKRACVNGVHQPAAPRKQVGVLISGSGTNLQALIDHTENPANHSAAKIVLVISNKPDVQGLKRAERAGIPTKVISHKEYKSRDDFDAQIHNTLKDAGVEIVCLAGFMRILTGKFVRQWNGRMINIHPSLLPSFKGGDAHQQVLAARVRISGCTVHFVAEEVDSGAILVQESVPVYATDTLATLADRVRGVEHIAFVKALELVASDQARLGEDNIIQWVV